MRRGSLVALCPVLLSLGACALGRPLPMSHDLVGEWVLAETDGAPAPGGVVVRFGVHGDVSGQVACNRFAGAYRVAAGAVRLRGVERTLAGCPDPEAAAAAERAGAPLLRSDAVAAALTRDGALRLEARDGRTLVLVRRG